ncbi:hypothetical protein LGM43_04750 [Burkholderia seminalis]|uniref:hypothetical protein n=1 Tax=Burkholderia seminalis TaxID=488731 RepID=UPI00158A691B|nr:hypothetical protein [Burkholderia seminalis]MBJ9966934.1 hypothetical protein [Burkholderia seminalis]MCA7949572.1 hypothetical protein [Burkholderia seminalis]MDN7586224.1 hypothetical protein [Burkholderia seminalis]
MGTQNWNGGNRLVVSQSNPLQCVNSIVNPINVAFLYNTTQAAQEVPVDFVGANQYFQQVKVAQTTGNQGSAALLTFSGPSNGGSASLTATLDPQAGSGAQAEAWLGSQSMPVNTTGLSNNNLPANGERYAFNKYSRYYFVPGAQRYVLSVSSGISAFYFALFNSSGQVDVYVLNAPDDSYQPNVQQFPGDTYAAANTKVHSLTQSSVSIPLFGANQQWVAMNADSVSDSTNATISLTALG